MPNVTDICNLYNRIKPSKTQKLWTYINAIIIGEEEGIGGGGGDNTKTKTIAAINILSPVNLLTEIVRAVRNTYIVPLEMAIVMNMTNISAPKSNTLYLNCKGKFTKTISLFNSECTIHETGHN